MEGIVFLTGSAARTPPMMVQRLAALPDRLRHPLLRQGEIQEFHYAGNPGAGRTGFTVAAIHTVTFPSDTGERGQRRRIIQFFLRCILIRRAPLE